jgi:hypothetical protein
VVPWLVVVALAGAYAGMTRNRAEQAAASPRVDATKVRVVYAIPSNFAPRVNINET